MQARLEFLWRQVWSAPSGSVEHRCCRPVCDSARCLCVRVCACVWWACVVLVAPPMQVGDCGLCGQ